jgi:hypothetical protein
MKNLFVLTVWTLTTSMTGCGGQEAVVGGPSEDALAEAGMEADAKTNPATEAQGVDVAAKIDVAELECPEGTRPQIGQSATGVEQWCEQDGVMQGPYKGYYADSTRKVGGQYVDNQPDGAWLWWHPNNTKASKGTYSRGKQAGIWTWWHPNGSRAQEGDFLAGRKAGKWTAWHEDGRKKEEGLYHNGNKNGVWTYYLVTGEEGIARTEKWQSGVRISTQTMGEEASADDVAVETAPANTPRKSGG